MSKIWLCHFVPTIDSGRSYDLDKRTNKRGSIYYRINLLELAGQKKKFAGIFVKFSGALEFSGVFRVFFRGSIHFRGFQGIFRVSGGVGHPASNLYYNYIKSISKLTQ